MTSPTGAFRALSRSWDGTALELKRFEEAVTIQTELEKIGDSGARRSQSYDLVAGAKG
jgi:hypothetical protein